jgi:hypothetical protein
LAQRIFVILLISAGLLIPNFWQCEFSQAASTCDQEFIVLGIERETFDEPVLWIVEVVNGDCIGTYLVQLQIKPDTVSVLSESFRYRDWKAIGERMGTKLLGCGLELLRVDSIWRASNKKFQMTIPRPDSAILVEANKSEFGASVNIEQWNRQHGTRAVMVPEIKDTKVTLSYYLPSGFYIDYFIERVYYFETRRHFYLLSFTKQPRLAHGLDSMHGFLLLRGARN